MTSGSSKLGSQIILAQVVVIVFLLVLMFFGDFLKSSYDWGRTQLGYSESYVHRYSHQDFLARKGKRRRGGRKGRKGRRGGKKSVKGCKKGKGKKGRSRYKKCMASQGGGGKKNLKGNAANKAAQEKAINEQLRTMMSPEMQKIGDETARARASIANLCGSRNGCLQSTDGEIAAAIAAADVKVDDSAPPPLSEYFDPAGAAAGNTSAPSLDPAVSFVAQVQTLKAARPPIEQGVIGALVFEAEENRKRVEAERALRSATNAEDKRKAEIQQAVAEATAAFAADFTDQATRRWDAEILADGVRKQDQASLDQLRAAQSCDECVCGFTAFEMGSKFIGQVVLMPPGDCSACGDWRFADSANIAPDGMFTEAQAKYAGYKMEGPPPWGSVPIGYWNVGEPNPENIKTAEDKLCMRLGTPQLPRNDYSQIYVAPNMEVLLFNFGVAGTRSSTLKFQSEWLKGGQYGTVYHIGPSQPALDERYPVNFGSKGVGKRKVLHKAVYQMGATYGDLVLWNSQIQAILVGHIETVILFEAPIRPFNPVVMLPDVARTAVAESGAQAAVHAKLDYSQSIDIKSQGGDKGSKDDERDGKTNVKYDIHMKSEAARVAATTARAEVFEEVRDRLMEYGGGSAPMNSGGSIVVPLSYKAGQEYSHPLTSITQNRVTGAYESTSASQEAMVKGSVEGQGMEMVINRRNDEARKTHDDRVDKTKDYEEWENQFERSFIDQKMTGGGKGDVVKDQTKGGESSGIVRETAKKYYAIYVGSGLETTLYMPGPLGAGRDRAAEQEVITRDKTLHRGKRGEAVNLVGPGLWCYDGPCPDPCHAGNPNEVSYCPGAAAKERAAAGIASVRLGGEAEGGGGFIANAMEWLTGAEAYKPQRRASLLKSRKRYTPTYSSQSFLAIETGIDAATAGDMDAATGVTRTGILADPSVNQPAGGWIIGEVVVKKCPSCDPNVNEDVTWQVATDLEIKNAKGVSSDTFGGYCLCDDGTGGKKKYEVGNILNATGEVIPNSLACVHGKRVEHDGKAYNDKPNAERTQSMQEYTDNGRGGMKVVCGRPQAEGLTESTNSWKDRWPAGATAEIMNQVEKTNDSMHLATRCEGNAGSKCTPAASGIKLCLPGMGNRDQDKASETLLCQTMHVGAGKDPEGRWMAVRPEIDLVRQIGRRWPLRWFTREMGRKRIRVTAVQDTRGSSSYA